MASKAAHLAVMRLSAMGDVAMTVPVLRALLKSNPELKITVISRGFFKPFFRDLPEVSFFSVDLDKRHKGFFGLYRLYQDIRALGVTAFADLHQVLRSKVVGFFFKLNGFSTASIDKGRDEKKALTRSENKDFRQLKTTFERYADVFRELGFSVDLTNPEFAQKTELSEDIVSITGQKVQKWIGIAPFAKHQGKVYPTDLMQKTIDLLSENSSYKLFLFGAGKEETTILESFASQRENVISMAGKVKFNQELDLISNLDLMLSMDSGNAHMAAMLGIPTVTLWGATHPFAGFAPFNQPPTNALTADRSKFPLLPTSIYGNKEVPEYEDAMRSISPKSVVEKINSVLNI